MDETTEDLLAPETRNSFVWCDGCAGLGCSAPTAKWSSSVAFEGYAAVIGPVIPHLSPLGRRSGSGRVRFSGARIATVSVRVFISYRRGETQDLVGRLRDYLGRKLGEDNIFLDVDSIEVGDDFDSVIRKTLREVDAVVCVIGSDFDPGRLAEQDDYVRRELREAFAQEKRVFPVVAKGAQMPTAAELPKELKALAGIQAADLRSDHDFHRDVDELVKSLNRSTGRAKWTAELISRKQSNKPNFTIILRAGDKVHYLEFLGTTMSFRATLDGDEIWSGSHLLTWQSIAFRLYKDGYRSRGLLRVKGGLTTYRAWWRSRAPKSSRSREAVSDVPVAHPGSAP